MAESGRTERTRTQRRPRREAVEEQVEALAAPPSVEADEGAEQPERAVPSQSTLANLMRKAIDGRRRMMEAQERLRELEFEIRQGGVDARSRFERLRATALDEYRRARAEAERARRQLASSLKMLPGRQDGRTRGAEAA